MSEKHTGQATTPAKTISKQVNLRTISLYQTLAEQGYMPQHPAYKISSYTKEGKLITSEMTNAVPATVEDVRNTELPAQHSSIMSSEELATERAAQETMLRGILPHLLNARHS